jgi:hypothetical protein
VPSIRDRGTDEAGVVICGALRYHDANDPAFPGVDRQRHGREGASALDARRGLGSSASGATLDGAGRTPGSRLRRQRARELGEALTYDNLTVDTQQA